MAVVVRVFERGEAVEMVYINGNAWTVDSDTGNLIIWDDVDNVIAELARGYWAEVSSK